MNIGFNPPGTKLLLCVAGYDYNEIIAITKGVPPYNIIIQGRLPGITISNHEESIILSGNPKTMGTYTFTIIVTDSNQITNSQTYKIKISLGKFAEDLNNLRENAITLKDHYSNKLYNVLYYDFQTVRFNLSQICDLATYDLIRSTIEGLFDIVDNPYISLNDSLEIVITTLPSTIRFIKSLP